MDSETGGFYAKEVDVLTLFMAVVDDNFRILEELDLKLKPNDRLPIVNQEAMEINKIDLEKHLKDPETITYAEARLKIIAFVKKYFKKRGRYSNLYPMGQNVMFDLKFIWEHIIPESEWDTLFSYNIEDTKNAGLFLKRAGWLPPSIGNLDSMVTHFEIPKLTAQEAKGDVRMTIEVYKKMIELMKSKKEGGQTQDLISLLEAE